MGGFEVKTFKNGMELIEKLTEETYHQRNSKRAEYDILKEAAVNIFGVGAIGSEIADCMAKAGTGTLVLFDNQLMKAHNPVRHLGTLEQVGEPKITAVGEILFKHNPFIHIWPVPLNLYDFDISGNYFLDNSITVSSVADDNVEAFVNQQLVIANKTAFYVRALRGGKAARIFRTNMETSRLRISLLLINDDPKGNCTA